MKIKDFEFNMRELAGSMGDFGTLFPLAIGYIVVCGMDPAGLLVMMGLANIATGIIYRLPMPIEPMKVLAVVAIAQRWSPSLVYASGFAMGMTWLFLAGTGWVEWLARVTPKSVVRGIQAALGVMLAVEGIKMISTAWGLGVLSIAIVLLLRENRYAPAAVVLMMLGVFLAAWKGALSGIQPPGFHLPPLTLFSFQEIWDSFVLAGFAQVPLTATNAVIATASLIVAYWPDRPVSERKLSLNMGIMNLVLPFFGGMPLCHGAGGLAGQYYFGARTGGTNVIEGVIEIILGIFFATSIATLFRAFPMAIIGAMMFLVGYQLTKFMRDVRPGFDLLVMILTVFVSLATNMAVGFAAGMFIYHLRRIPHLTTG
ncbi:MAG: putative sulfate/molybdate transporter [Deltaproteobacteria bacterium]|nr:putative sulfate/molybdate transporter [Deltaproteobacteria bacterium]MBW2307649.1 putative sulfate/molybdate transporter [Deltaproteobacteria bacterium]